MVFQNGIYLDLSTKYFNVGLGECPDNFVPDKEGRGVCLLAFSLISCSLTFGCVHSSLAIMGASLWSIIRKNLLTAPNIDHCLRIYYSLRMTLTYRKSFGLSDVQW